VQFIYVITSWEGFVVDNRVLHDAMSRKNGLKIPLGKIITVEMPLDFNVIL